MKKAYIIPEMEIVDIKMSQQLLAGSDPSLSGSYNGGSILSPELSSDDDIEF